MRHPPNIDEGRFSAWLRPQAFISTYFYCHISSDACESDTQEYVNIRRGLQNIKNNEGMSKIHLVLH